MSLARLISKLAKTQIATAVFIIATAASGLAQRPELSVKLVAQQVLQQGDKESLVPAEKAKPGDIIEYQAAYANTGDAAANKLVATLPIPAGLALLSASAKPAAEQASMDGKNFSNVPLTRRVKNERGITEDQPVPLSEYRALRWSIPQLQPGATVIVALRARMASTGSSQ
jgi:uncharacterized repeat protein (TIGR01451 family)